MRAGGPLTDAQRKLAEDHVPPASRIAGRVSRGHSRARSEIYSAVFLQLCLAARRHDEGRAGPFSVAVRRPLLWRAFAARSFPDVTAEGFLFDSIVDHRRHPGATVDDRDELEWLLGRISRPCAEAIRLTYLEGLTQSQVARRLRCRRPTVGILIRQGIETMRGL